MKPIIEWLSEFNAEYDAYSQILYIRKAMRVNEFIYLKSVLETFRYKLKDIIIKGK